MDLIPTDSTDPHLAHPTSVQVTKSDIEAMDEALKADLCGDLGRINAVAKALKRCLPALGEIRVVVTPDSSFAITKISRFDLGPEVKRWLESAYEGNPVAPIAIELPTDSPRKETATPTESRRPLSTFPRVLEAYNATRADGGVAIQV